jgi:hypothetical protein
MWLFAWQKGRNGQKVPLPALGKIEYKDLYFACELHFRLIRLCDA